MDELKEKLPPKGMRSRIVNILNRLSKTGKDEDFEWTDRKIAIVLFFWIWSLVGVGIAIYGLIRYVIMEHQESFGFILIGIGITISGNILVGVAGKILNRKK